MHRFSIREQNEQYFIISLLKKYIGDPILVIPLESVGIKIVSLMKRPLLRFLIIRFIM